MCQKQLTQILKIALAESRIPYDVWFLDEERFIKYWEKYLHLASVKEVEREGVLTLFRNMSYKELQKIVPEARIQLTMEEIKNGNIAEIIIDLLQ